MMKAVQKVHTGDPNCSCTSCLHKSGAENPSLRRFIAQGSRIDRLYYGKYIPLRERKLLERLVRTRAVYDDIRAKLISDSTISLSTKADKKLSSKELDDNEKGSGAIFELVDLVDKGATLGLSECCSCCSCSSKAQLHGHARHKHQRPNFVSRRPVYEKERLETHRKKRGVRFKAKHIRSDPCTCTFKLSGLLKKKNKPMEVLDLQPVSNEERQPRHKRLREFARRSYENIKQSNKQLEEKMLEGIQKIKDSATNMQERLQVDVQASAVKLKQTTKSQKPKVKTTAPKKLSKNNLQLNELLAICMCPEDEIFGKSPKESLLDVYKQKSKEKLIQAKSKLKSAMKSTIERKPKSTKIKTKASGAHFVPKKNSAICVCPEDEILASSLDVSNQKSKERLIQTKNKLKSAMNYTIERKPKSASTYVVPENDLAFQVKKDSIRKFQEELRRKQIMKEWECDPECIEGLCNPEECYIKLKRKHRNMKHKGLEYHIRKHEKRTGDVLSQKNVKIQNKALAIQKTGQTNKPILGHERENKNTAKKTKPGKKRAVKKKDIKLVPKQEVVTAVKKPSSRKGVRVSSSISFSLEFFKEQKPKEIPKTNSKEPAKRTASGINYKKTTTTPKVRRHQRTSQVLMKHSSRDTQTEMRSLKRCFCTLKLKSKKSKAKHRKRHKITSADKSITTIASDVPPCKHSDCSVQMCETLVCEKIVSKKISNAHTNTENKLKKKKEVKSRYLLPYECEPGICTPGSCDPYECIKLINMREARVKKRSVPCFCPSRKTKSTSTLTSRSAKTSKAKIAQSYTYSPPQKRNEGKVKIERKNVHNVDGRQAVKIGSTFSFNIEFYKNTTPQHYTPPSDLKTFTVQPKQKEYTKPKLRERAFQGDVASFHKNTPTQIYKKERNESVSTTLKRCFCTLKLQRKSHSKLKRKKMFSTGTKTIEEPFNYIETSTKGTKTKKKYLKSLKPYECEPFTCIPGECNPYECLERINRRNLRDIGVSSTVHHSDDKGSSTSEKLLKAVKTQSKPRSKEQKVLTKFKEPKKQPQQLKEPLQYISSIPSKRAVNIGSSFSFNIEFYKNKKPTKILKPNYQMMPAVKLDTRPVTKNRGVKIVKLNVANLKTQAEELKKHNKTSTTKPLLKRCFCTLNLQKKGNNVLTAPLKKSVFQPSVYTVNTAMVNQNEISIFRTRSKNYTCLSTNANPNVNNSLSGQRSDCVVKSSYNECKILSSIKHLQCQSCNPLITNTNKLEKITSNFNTTLKIISQSYISDNLKLSEANSPLVEPSNTLNHCSSHINQEKKCVVYTANDFEEEKTYLTGFRQYLKRYFCAMNLQVVRNKYTTGKQKNEGTNRPRKLKPYECEPGVCVPGECDPYECLKRISKRDSNFSKKTGTESTVTSTSSYTNRSPKFKSYKVQSPSEKTSKTPVSRPVYQEQHQLKNQGEKQAVRVGSSFSFDIEFFKKSGSPPMGNNIIKTSTVTRPTYPKRKKAYSSKTTRIKKQGFRNQHSQSAFSKTLQKASATLPRMKRCFCTLKLQKKGRLQKKELKQPSESLQTEAIVPQITTVTRGQKAPKFKPLKIAQSLKPYECPPNICTPGECNPYECLEIMKRLKYNQTADFGTDAVTGDSKSMGSMTISEPKKRTRIVNAKPKIVSKTNSSEGRTKKRFQPTKVQSTRVITPTKQVVRIGSSLSFDVEFHKSKPSVEYPKEYITSKPSKSFQHKVKDMKEPYLKMKHRTSETSKALRDKQLQIKNTVQAASTMTTSFMKRCFCVLKLRKNKIKTTDEASVAKIINKPVNVDKKINTKRYKERILKLEPYECEPGVCIPGECDPYACEKLIKRRNLRTTSSSTAFTSTRSASSSSPRMGKKNINTQFQTKKISKEPRKQVYTKPQIRDSNRQAVRIGSNFSFDIEFYKNKTPKFKDYDIIPQVKTKDIVYVDQKKKKQKHSGTKSQSVPFKSQLSQMNINKRDFAGGINNVIKRCFCTLQLYNQRKRKQSKNKEEKEKPIKKVVHSKSVMTKGKNKLNVDSLLPYECEPNICIPYECDPYECEKLIKLRQRRQQREIGMSTQHSSNQSTGSSTVPFKKPKKRTQSVSFKSNEKIKKVRKIKRVQEAQSKQCVKIGSSFSFDIEFFKNRNTPGLQLDQKPQYIQRKVVVPKVDKVNRRIKTKTKTQGLQSHKRFHTSPSQMGNMLTKTQSTMARFTPPLKRCFCTFYLKRPKKEPLPVLKPVTSNVSTEAKLDGSKVKAVPKLLPYECEPNICVPGECNPLECLERIKSRLKQQKNYGTSTQHLRKNEFGSSMVTAKARNKKSQFKSFNQVKEKQHRQPVTTVTHKPNKQAVRIGSNFSFNIDFYKQSGSENFDRQVSVEPKPKYVSKPIKTTKSKPTRKINRQVNKKLDHKIQRDRGSQSPFVKQSSKSSAVEPFLKRCFCTLKLQKKPVTKTSKTTLKTNQNDIQKVSIPKIVSIDKGTLTKKYKNKIDLSAYECEPFTCIPGECDPYECQKRIQARNLKSKNISTQMIRDSSGKGVGADLAHLHSKKIQSNLVSDLPTQVNKQSNIVEVPRFGNLFNKQAVRIGSNFSFNIEFYKEVLVPTNEPYPECEKIKCYEETKPRKNKRHVQAITTSKVTKTYHKGVQGDNVKTDSKALEVGNALKRCFCTLKLQKDLNTKLSKPSIQKAQHPQVIEVRRVSVQNKKNKITKQTFTEVKSIGTKTKAKYLNGDNAICDPSTCRNFISSRSQEMKVIHPYTPSKFNKTPSKTMQNQGLFKDTKSKPRKTKITNRGKRLTKKKSNNALPMEHLGKDLNPANQRLSTFQKMMCKCAYLFSRKTQGDNLPNSFDEQFNNENENTNNNKKKRNINEMRKSDRRSHRDNSEQKGKKSSSLQNKQKCNESCPYIINQSIKSRYQVEDTAQSPTVSLKMLKKHENDNVEAISQKKKSIVKEWGFKKDKGGTKQFQDNLPNKTEDFFCSHCKNIKMNKRHSQPLKVHFVDTPVNKQKDGGKKTKAKDGLALLNKSVDHIDKHRKSSQKNAMQDDIKQKKIAKYCKYCVSCGEKLIHEEIHKAAGDQKRIKAGDQKKNKADDQKSTKEKTPDHDKTKQIFMFKRSVDNICSAKGPEKPLFEMHLDSDDYGIVNKEEVYENVTKFRKKSIKDRAKHTHLDKEHGESCRCCICLAKRNKTGANFNVHPKGPKGRRSRLPTGKPCICGSRVCKDELAALKREFHSFHRRTQQKPCDCGSPVCAAETEFMNTINFNKDKLTCICAKERAKLARRLKAKEMKLEQKTRAKRLKHFHKLDRSRKKIRLKEDKEMEKKINKNASDTILVAESLIDIGKFGITACTDILRLVARTAMDPKHAYQTLKEMKEHPSLIARQLSSGVKGSGMASTCKRIRLRCLSMNGVKTIRNILEQYPLTNYLLYIAHKDPRRRMPKRRPRQREQLDFNCSLYMGSLRKRPYLWVYNNYPWVYPHFLSLLNVWKQFTDIALFLLAVLVWSPCIFAMEACRAFMCCFFCTG